MNQQHSSNHTTNSGNHSRFLPGLILGFALCTVFYFVYAVSTDSDNNTAPIENRFSNAQVSQQHATQLFLEKVKATYPAFEKTGTGALSVLISPQATYTVLANQSQQVETSSQYFKNKLRDDLNNAGIAYNVVEGLGHWTILWNEQLYLPAQ